MFSYLMLRCSKSHLQGVFAEPLCGITNRNRRKQCLLFRRRVFWTVKRTCTTPGRWTRTQAGVLCGGIIGNGKGPVLDEFTSVFENLWSRGTETIPLEKAEQTLDQSEKFFLSRQTTFTCWRKRNFLSQNWLQKFKNKMLSIAQQVFSWSKGFW